MWGSSEGGVLTAAPLPPAQGTSAEKGDPLPSLPAGGFYDQDEGQRQDLHSVKGWEPRKGGEVADRHDGRKD